MEPAHAVDSEATLPCAILMPTLIAVDDLKGSNGDNSALARQVIDRTWATADMRRKGVLSFLQFFKTSVTNVSKGVEYLSLMNRSAAVLGQPMSAHNSRVIDRPGLNPHGDLFPCMPTAYLILEAKTGVMVDVGWHTNFRLAAGDVVWVRSNNKDFRFVTKGFRALQIYRDKVSPPSTFCTILQWR
jgi:hypothetical protein